MQWIPPGEARRARVDGPYTLDDVGPCRAVPLGEVAARRSVSNRESSTSEEFTPNHRERGHRVNTNPRPNDRDTRRSEEHTSELQSRGHLVCRLLLEKKKKTPGHSSSHRTNFTVSSWRASGEWTGISSADLADTIRFALAAAASTQVISHQVNTFSLV